MTLNVLWPPSQQGPEWTPKPMSVLASKDTKNLLYHRCKATLSSKFLKQWLMGEERRKAGEEEEAAASCTSCARCGISLLYILLHIPGPSCIGPCWKWLRDLPWTGSGLWERSCHKNNFGKQDSALWIQGPIPIWLKTSRKPQHFCGYHSCPIKGACVEVTLPALPCVSISHLFWLRHHCWSSNRFVTPSYQDHISHQDHILARWPIGRATKCAPHPHGDPCLHWVRSGKGLILSSDLGQAVKHTGASQGLEGWVGLFLELWP